MPGEVKEPGSGARDPSSTVPALSLARGRKMARALAGPRETSPARLTPGPGRAADRLSEGQAQADLGRVDSCEFRRGECYHRATVLGNRQTGDTAQRSWFKRKAGGCRKGGLRNNVATGQRARLASGHRVATAVREKVPSRIHPDAARRVQLGHRPRGVGRGRRPRQAREARPVALLADPRPPPTLRSGSSGCDSSRFPLWFSPLTSK